jgi:hypothetical protein
MFAMTGQLTVARTHTHFVVFFGRLQKRTLLFNTRDGSCTYFQQVRRQLFEQVERSIQFL